MMHLLNVYQLISHFINWLVYVLFRYFKFSEYGFAQYYPFKTRGNSGSKDTCLLKQLDLIFFFYYMYRLISINIISNQFIQFVFFNLITYVHVINIINTPFPYHSQYRPLTNIDVYDILMLLCTGLAVNKTNESHHLSNQCNKVDISLKKLNLAR